jgi:hypothetical protein
MPPLRVVLLLSALLPATATAAGRGGHALLLGGGQTEAEAQAALLHYQRTARSGVSPRAGFPRVVKSETLGGLVPGLHLAVLGVCEDVQQARRVLELVSLELPGASLKPVQGEVAGQCPGVELPPAQPPEGFEHRGSWPARPAGKGATFEAFVRPEVRPLDAPCEPPVLLLRLQLGGLVLGEERLEGECVGAPLEDSAEYVHHSTTYEVERPLALGARHLLLVRATTREEGGVSKKYLLVGDACGRTSTLAHLFRFNMLQASSELQVRPLGSGAEAWRTLEVSAEGSPCAAYIGCRVPAERHTWSEEACLYR